MKKHILILLFVVLAGFHAEAHVELLYPVGGETFHPGNIVTIEWKELVSHSTLNWDLYFSSNGGQTWESIQINMSTDMLSYQWTVPEDLTTQGKIKIVQDNVDIDYEDISDNFTISIPVLLPLTIDAGNDTIFCASNLDEITIGGNPTATGGTPPYQYSWSTTLEVRDHVYTASLFLNDSSVANPTFKGFYDTLKFYLSVSDGIDSTAIDSVTVRFSEFITCLGQCVENIDEGDSVQLHHCIDGGILPYTHSWTPAESLSDPTIGNPWAKPTSTTTYNLILTDSAGCETQSNCHVTVTPKEHYEPVLVREGRLWSNTELGTEHGHPYYSYYIKFEGDATINNVRYKKILKSEDEAHTSWKLHGYIREDSSKKVYIYDDYFKTDLLVYDFGLQVGDSIMPPDSFQYVYVCDISYITFEHSPDSFKQIELSDLRDCRYPFRWIEGIGSPRGVLIGLQEVNICCIELNLVCYYENDTLKYHNSYFSNCFPQGFPEGIGERVDESYGITVSPNPFIDQLTIDGLPDVIQSIEIYDLFGRLVYQNPKPTAGSITISDADINPGLYLLRVRDKDSGQTITSSKIVKQ